MTDRIDMLAHMLTETRRLIDGVDPVHLSLPTPCEEFDVAALLDHMCTWIAVFDATANDRAASVDPETFHLESGWSEHFAEAADGVVAGLRRLGVDRDMVMTTNPIPGNMVLDMLTMEYIGHGIDLAKATGQQHRFTDEQAAAALAASERMIQPPYRGTDPGQFHPVVDVAADAPIADRFIGFLGRDPAWSR